MAAVLEQIGLKLRANIGRNRVMHMQQVAASWLGTRTTVFGMRTHRRWGGAFELAYVGKANVFAQARNTIAEPDH